MIQDLSKPQYGTNDKRRNNDDKFIEDRKSVNYAKYKEEFKKEDFDVRSSGDYNFNTQRNTKNLDIDIEQEVERLSVMSQNQDAREI
jgi:hypothetical protein